MIRRGRRAGRRHLVVHAYRPEIAASEHAVDGRHGVDGKHEVDRAPTRTPSDRTRVGFVVSKAVGGSVVRHRVSRRLRHLVRDRLPELPAGMLLVVRALPPAAEATSQDLGADLDSALRKLRLLPKSGEQSEAGRQR